MYLFSKVRSCACLIKICDHFWRAGGDCNAKELFQHLNYQSDEPRRVHNLLF